MTLLPVMCLALVLSLTGAFAFPALIPTFTDAWGLSNTEAGWIAGIYMGSYALASPVLIAMTDRIDARGLFLAGTIVTAVAAVAFALLAEGFWSALALRVLAGVGLAGTYIPGLRILVDRWPADDPSRAVAIYSAAFGLGAAISYLVAGELGRWMGWQAAFAGTGATSFGATILVFLATRPQAPTPPKEPTALLDFRPVLRNRLVVAYILSYGLHVWELLAFRSWIVAFLTASLALSGETPVLSPTMVATLTGLLAMVAIVAGQEVARRFGTTRTVAVLMILTAAVGGTIGFTAGQSYWIVVLASALYTFMILSDSGAITAGTVQAAEPGRRGATLAVHSLFGFGLGFLGPLAVGVVLDVGGGAGSAFAWGLAFAIPALLTLLGPVLLTTLTREPKAR